MKRGTVHSPGDLVFWEASKERYTGVVIEVWDSNVYEPEECNVLLSSGETAIIRSRNLRPVQKAEALPE